MSRKPLSHIRVVDLSRVIAGPLAAQLLGDLGAEVIKVERAGPGDDARRMGPPFLKDTQGRDTRETPIILGSNRNKKSITLNLARPEGQAIARRLAGMSDVLIENFKVGDLKRYGLDQASLRELNPRLIYCSVTGFGQTGPYAPRPGYDSIFQAMGGLMSVTGYPDDEGGAPVKTGPSIADFIAGQFAAIGVITALYDRDANRQASGGRGQHIDVALLDSVIASLSHYTAQYLAMGEVPVRRGTQGNGGLPSQMFPCADGAVMVVCGNDEQYRRFCVALGHPALADDDRFVTNPLRVRHRRELTAALDAVTRQWRQADMLAALEAAGVPAGPILDLKQVFEDPQVQHRGAAVEVPHPLSGTVRIGTNPIKFSETPIRDYTAPPTQGQHNDEVFRGLLGLDDGELRRLKEAGIV
jgi:crotonobetainyl-CoA:carnitine CoA-transferase CaiB-like acyl-CoA transferase